MNTVSESRSELTAAANFEALQKKLAPLWRTMNSSNYDPHTVVVVPSVSFDKGVLDHLQGVQHYEERFLILLMLLRHPTARLIYVTSEPILPSVVDYYLHLLPGVIPSQARRRLFLVSTLDGTVRPLTEKLLERPRLIERLRQLVQDPDRAYLVPFNTTELERELALRLDIPIYGADPKFRRFGTKSGSRKLFEQAGVPHPAGYGDLTSMEEVAGAISKLRSGKPSIEKVLVKTNEGVSGFGNVIVDLKGFSHAGHPRELVEVEQSLRRELPGELYEQYNRRLEGGGGIVEERISGELVRSPSAQILITPLGEVQVLSTHDQLLGGPGGQSYLGCRFPADTAYAVTITTEAQKVGELLSKEGVVGRAAIDFVVVASDHGWEAYAIELNLRQGGTTHPFLTLQFLTDGRYVPEEAVFIAPNGRRKFFVASDHVESPLYRGFTPDDLFDMAVRHRLHFDHAQQTGVVFHMMSGLPELGRTGLTAVADSPQEAEWIYDRVVNLLDAQAQDSFQQREPFGAEE